LVVSIRRIGVIFEVIYGAVFFGVPPNIFKVVIKIIIISDVMVKK
jgi:hypothetical protein